MFGRRVLLPAIRRTAVAVARPYSADKGITLETKFNEIDTEIEALKKQMQIKKIHFEHEKMMLDHSIMKNEKQKELIPTPKEMIEDVSGDIIAIAMPLGSAIGGLMLLGIALKALH